MIVSVPISIKRLSLIIYYSLYSNTDYPPPCYWGSLCVRPSHSLTFYIQILLTSFFLVLTSFLANNVVFAFCLVESIPCAGAAVFNHNYSKHVCHTNRLVRLQTIQHRCLVIVCILIQTIPPHVIGVLRGCVCLSVRHIHLLFTFKYF